jgi:hypothetical protein
LLFLNDRHGAAGICLFMGVVAAAYQGT